MTLRAVIVDDSEIATRKLASVLEADADVRVVGTFSTVEALRAWPDLESASFLVLDVWMPGTSGLSAIRELAGRVPVIVVSEAAEGSELALEAVAQGAAAFVSKRSLGDAAGESRLRAIARSAAARGGTRELTLLLVVGSTGAPRALERLVPALRGTTAAIVVVQHLPPGGQVAFARWIEGLGVAARPAQHGDVLTAGRALIAPAGRHLLVEGSVVRLAPGGPGELHVPAGDRAISSAASLGRRLVALVLSGMGRDGALGIARALDAGATCLAQSPDESAAPSMPRAALEVSPRVRALTLERLGTDVRELVSRRR